MHKARMSHEELAKIDTYRDRVGLAEHIRHTLRGAEIAESFVIPHQRCHAMMVKDVVFDSRDLCTFTVGPHVLLFQQLISFIIAQGSDFDVDPDLHHGQLLF